jgi:hypothetical protein
MLMDAGAERLGFHVVATRPLVDQDSEWQGDALVSRKRVFVLCTVILIKYRCILSSSASTVNYHHVRVIVIFFRFSFLFSALATISDLTSHAPMISIISTNLSR